MYTDVKQNSEMTNPYDLKVTLTSTNKDCMDYGTHYVFFLHTYTIFYSNVNQQLQIEQNLLIFCLVL